VIALALLLAGAPSPATPPDALPPRVARVVLHCPGGPSYGHPERRWTFLAPLATQQLWSRRFGTHWIVWTDGSLWPRHPGRGEAASRVPPVDGPADAAWRQRLAREAAPVYAQAHGFNDDSVGIEVSHSGRSDEAFPPAQVRTVAWLVETLIDMSQGRLTPASIVGHKDVDERPAYVDERCERSGCAVFVDDEGRPFRRRVDPPESLFAALAAAGLAIPRPPAADAELRRTESLAGDVRPRIVRP